MGKEHNYQAKVTWTGGWTDDKRNYRSYSREHLIEVPGKEAIRGSSDAAFRGDAGLHNPEDMLVASVSACHMLWYLHLCTVNGIVIASYVDDASGVMAETPDGAGRFSSITLKPRIVLESGDPEKAMALHHEAHEKCFIANSVNFPIECEAQIS